MENYSETIRDGCTEIYSLSWHRNGRAIRKASWDVNAEEPFFSTLFPRYGSEVERHNSPASYRFCNAAEMTLEILLSGVMRYTQDGIFEQVRPGELYIIHKGSDTRFEQLQEDHFHRVRLMVRGNLVNPLAESLHLTGKRIIPLRSPEKFADRFREIIQLLTEHTPGSCAEISGRTAYLLNLIAAEAGRTRVLPQLLTNLLQDMNQDLHHQYSMSDFARRNGCGVHTLMRLFRKYLGITPSAYREHLRYERACQMLQTNTLTIKEISERLGYCDQLYFSAAFKRNSGISPSEYRRTRNYPEW